MTQKLNRENHFEVEKLIACWIKEIDGISNETYFNLIEKME
jgi:hypothetical protein